MCGGVEKWLYSQLYYILTADVDLDGVLDLALAVGGDARVIALVLLDDAGEVQGAVHLLHVPREMLRAVLVPLERGRSRALRLARDLRSCEVLCALKSEPITRAPGVHGFFSCSARERIR